jgi:hypothetical protein
MLDRISASILQLYLQLKFVVEINLSLIFKDFEVIQQNLISFIQTRTQNTTKA